MRLRKKNYSVFQFESFVLAREQEVKIWKRENCGLLKIIERIKKNREERNIWKEVFFKERLRSEIDESSYGKSGAW